MKRLVNITSAHYHISTSAHQQLSNQHIFTSAIITSAHQHIIISVSGDFSLLLFLMAAKKEGS